MRGKTLRYWLNGCFLFGFSGAVILGSSSAYAEKEVFAPEHVAKLRSVRSAKISPDGKLIAYTLSIPRKPFEDDNGPAWSELHVLNAAGQTRPFITGEVNIGGVQWTPDGKGIAFTAKRGKDEHSSLYVIPIDGGEARKVVDHETAISSYTFSPDGTEVAFIATDKEDKEVKKKKDKGFNAEIYEEDFREKRVWIAKVGDDDDEDEPRSLKLKGTPSSLHWSPVDRRLLVALAPTPLIDDHYMQRRLRVVDADSGEVQAFINNPGKLGQVAWSPDGKHIALISAQDLNDPAAGRLMIAPSGGVTVTDLIPGYQGHIRSIAWQDAHTIMFLGDEGLFTVFGEIRRDGSDTKIHVGAGKMVLTSMHLSKDGKRAALLSSSPGHPTEVFAMAYGDASPKRLTDSNPWLADMRLAKQEPLKFKAQDGLKIEGVLIHPLDEEPEKRYPLILAVHGGPEANDRNGWQTAYSRPGQVAAARGFAVFYPNYRGSTGRGVAFSKMGQADYGGKEFDDLIDAVDHLIEIGLVNRDRVGIIGGSYGGFATAWCSTYHTDRFAAGCMFVGISDHVSTGGTTDIPEEMYLVHSQTRLWDAWQFFLERSPIYYVKQAKTPLLILHGKNDTRVHPSQSMELYRHLKTIGQTPVRLVFYPGEGHGNRKSAGRYDYSLRTLRWFEHYLKGEGGDPPPHELTYPLEEEQKEDENDDDESAE